MTRKSTIYILTDIVFLMALLQAPFFYYYTFGLFALFVVTPYMLAGCILTITLLLLIFKSKDKQGLHLPKVGALMALLLGIASLFMQNVMEEWDWKFRKSTRNEIVQQVKSGELKPNAAHNDFICSLNAWKFPPISNGGNEIAIYSGANGKVTVQFYIDQGFLAHYSAFVYTDDLSRKNAFEERQAGGKGEYAVKKLEQNWYRISY